jgi:hypothetical protein
VTFKSRGRVGEHSHSLLSDYRLRHSCFFSSARRGGNLLATWEVIKRERPVRCFTPFIPLPTSENIHSPRRVTCLASPKSAGLGWRASPLMHPRPSRLSSFNFTVSCLGKIVTFRGIEFFQGVAVGRDGGAPLFHVGMTFLTSPFPSHMSEESRTRPHRAMRCGRGLQSPRDPRRTVPLDLTIPSTELTLHSPKYYLEVQLRRTKDPWEL